VGQITRLIFSPKKELYQMNTTSNTAQGHNAGRCSFCNKPANYVVPGVHYGTEGRDLALCFICFGPFITGQSHAAAPATYVPPTPTPVVSATPTANEEGEIDSVAFELVAHLNDPLVNLELIEDEDEGQVEDYFAPLANHNVELYCTTCRFSQTISHAEWQDGPTHYFCPNDGFILDSQIVPARPRYAIEIQLVEVDLKGKFVKTLDTATTAAIGGPLEVNQAITTWLAGQLCDELYRNVGGLTDRYTAIAAEK
jgi:hypothetical protein